MDDSSDCLIRGNFLPDTTTIDFDSHVVGLVLAVSDNTRFRASRHPLGIPLSMTKKSLESITVPTSRVDNIVPLPTIPEGNIEQSISISHFWICNPLCLLLHLFFLTRRYSLLLYLPLGLMKFFD